MSPFSRTGRALARLKTFMAIPTWRSSMNVLLGPREGFAGAWQSNVSVESKENLLAFSAVFACVSLIADDISKLRIKLLGQNATTRIWQEVTTNSPFWPVLRKPNKFQTRVQFISNWIVCKLLNGNTYILKERDNRGIVVAMYILDPRLVTPLVTETGDVYYRLNTDYLSGVMESVVIPASEIIHDRMLCLWHPLVGISPIIACGTSGTQGLRIQKNSEEFFKNMSRPSGHLTAPDAISDPAAARLKAEFEKNFSGSNIGRLLVTGDGLKYEAMTIPATDAQLIEQLKWTVEDVARCFKIPPYKLGLTAPPATSIPVLNQDYYSQTLQVHIESCEILLDEGLGLTSGPPPIYGTEFDLDGLLRMDPVSRADRYAKEIGSGMRKPNEARASEDLEPVAGGDECYLQQQNYSLAALAKRDAKSDPFSTGGGATPALPAPSSTPTAESTPTPVQDALADAVIKAFLTAPAWEPMRAAVE